MHFFLFAEHFPNRTLEEMAHPYGFKNIRFRGAGRFPYLWKSTVMIAEA